MNIQFLNYLLALVMSQQRRSFLAWGLQDLLPHNASHSTRSAMVGCEERINNSGFVLLVNCHCRLKTGVMGRRTHCTHKLFFSPTFFRRISVQAGIRIGWVGASAAGNKEKLRISPSSPCEHQGPSRHHSLADQGCDPAKALSFGARSCSIPAVPEIEIVTVGWGVMEMIGVTTGQ